MDARLAQEFFKLRNELAGAIKTLSKSEDLYHEADAVADGLLVRFNINPIKE